MVYTEALLPDPLGPYEALGPFIGLESKPRRAKWCNDLRQGRILSGHTCQELRSVQGVCQICDGTEFLSEHFSQRCVCR